MKEGQEIMLRQFGKDHVVGDTARREKMYEVLNGELGELNGGSGTWNMDIISFMFSV